MRRILILWCPLRPSAKPDVVQLRREVEPVPPDVVEPVELGEILKQGRGDGGYTLTHASANRP